MPPLHRLFTDFAISFVIISFIFEMISRIFRKPHMHVSAVIVLIAGMLVTIPCILTGLHEAKSLFTIDPVHEVMVWHRAMAFVFLGVLVLLSIWGVLRKGLINQTSTVKKDPPFIPPYNSRGEGENYPPFSPPEADKFPPRSRGEDGDLTKQVPPLFLFVLLVVVILVGVTGFLGEKMVYKYGAGKPQPTALGVPNLGIQSSRGFWCPIHRELTSANPGLCPKCGVRMIPIMDLPSPKSLKKKGE